MKKSIRQSFVDRVRHFASVHGLLVSRGKYIVTLSGGADSVSLLLVMRSLAESLHIDVEAAHCNFHLRGEESIRDENFCKDLCSRLGVPLHLVHFATKEYADLHHVSIEMAARDLRYRYFENLRQDINATAICVAHHRDDSVETVLLNLVRGTGIRGLRGIQPRNGFIVRPLLCVTRNEIVGYLNSLNQEYVTDSTNLVNDVKRNKIRLDVMPLLQQLNPDVGKAIFDTSLNLCEAFKVYDNAMLKSIGDVCMDGCCDVDKPIRISIERLLDQPSSECTLFHVLSVRSFTSQQITSIYEAMLGMASGKTFVSSTHELLFDRGMLIVQPLNYKVCTKIMLIPETGVYVYDDDKKIHISIEHIGDGFVVSRERMRISVDADKVKFPLSIRHVKSGERFIPFGMNRAKLISDYLTDHKRTLFDKRRQLVVADADNHVVWLVGERTDNRAKITPESKMALIISVNSI